MTSLAFPSHDSAWERTFPCTIIAEYQAAVGIHEDGLKQLSLVGLNALTQ
jgi:hypothetical protein